MKILVIAATSLRRSLRDRTGLFFIFLLPVLLILVIGVVFGGGFAPRVGLVVEGTGPLARDLAAAVETIEEFAIERYATEENVVFAIERGDLEAGLIIPAGYDREVTATTAEVTFVSSPSTGGMEIRQVLDAEITGQSTRVRVARFVADQMNISFPEGLAIADTTEAISARLRVVADSPGSASSVGQFDLGAAQNLVLFMFVTALASSATLIQSRRYGVSRRMLSTPTSANTVVAGETLGRFAVAMTQGLFIIAVAAIAFGVQWGSPFGAAAIVISFALVGTGAGVLIGSLFDNDQQAGGIGTFLGLGLGAFGGSMVPLEVFPETIRTIAHFTPHAWALDGFSELIRADAGIADIATEIAVLLAYAAVLIVVAAWLFRRKITA